MNGLDAILMASVAHGPTHEGFFGALLAIGASLIGGVASRNAAKKRDEANRKAAEELAATPMVTDTKSTTITNTKNESYVDYEQMMHDAEKAGFNPVTFLMAGGMASYTDSVQSQRVDQDGTSVTTGHNAAAAAQLAQPTAPSMGEVFAGALGAGINTFLDDRKQAQANLFQKELVDMQIKGRNTPGASNGSRSFYTPSRTHQGPLGVKAVGGVAYPTGAPTSPEMMQSTVMNPHDRQMVDPTLRNAEDFEARYGDIMQEVFGVRNLIGDKLYDVTGKTARETADTIMDNWSKKGLPTVTWGAVAPRVTSETVLSGPGFTIRRNNTPMSSATGGGGGW